MRRLYDSYAGVLAGICARYITDADDQKDVLQESLIQIYTHISSFTYQGRGSLQAWMARITINQALMYLRAQASTTMTGEVESIADDTTDEPDVAGLSESEILDMIRRLPVGYRTVFNLYAIEGKSRKEIAAELCLSEGTVKRHVSEILAKTGYDSILRLAVNAVADGSIVPNLKH